jgi:hypothetical protein
MKAKKKKPLPPTRKRASQKSRQNKKTKKSVPVARSKKTVLKKKLSGSKKPRQKKSVKKAEMPSQKFYITINGKKVSLENEIIRKYNLRAGDFLPFSKHRVFIEK